MKIYILIINGKIYSKAFTSVRELLDYVETIDKFAVRDRENCWLYVSDTNKFLIKEVYLGL